MQIMPVQDFAVFVNDTPANSIEGEGESSFGSFIDQGLKATDSKESDQIPAEKDEPELDPGLIMAALIQPQPQPELEPPEVIDTDPDSDIVINLEGQEAAEPPITQPGLDTEVIMTEHDTDQSDETARMPETTPQKPATEVETEVSCPLEIENEPVEKPAVEAATPDIKEFKETPVEKPAVERGNVMPEEKKTQPKEDNILRPDHQRADIRTVLAEGTISGENAMKADAPPVYATKDSLIDEMVEQIKLGKSEKGESIEIQLKPTFLGKVSIQLTMEAGSLQAKIRTEDESVRSLLTSQLDTLRESLAEKGIKVAEVEVSYFAQNNMSFKDESGQHEEPRNQHQHIAAIDRITDTPLFALQEPAMELYSGEEPEHQGIEISA